MLTWKSLIGQLVNPLGGEGAVVNLRNLRFDRKVNRKYSMQKKLYKTMELIKIANSQIFYFIMCVCLLALQIRHKKRLKILNKYDHKKIPLPII